MVVDESCQQRNVFEMLIVRPILVVQERTDARHGKQATTSCTHKTVAQRIVQGVGKHPCQSALCSA